MAVRAGTSEDRPEEISGLKRWLTSTTLIVFTMVVAAICIVLLSSTLTQSRLANLAIEGVELNIRKLDHLAQQWAQIRHERAKQSRKLQEAETAQQDKLPARTTADNQYDAATREIEGALAGFYFRIKDIEPELAALIHQKGYEDQVGKIRGSKDKLLAKHAVLESTVAQIETLYEAFRAARQKRGAARAASAGPEQAVKLHKQAIAEADQQLKTVFDLVKTDLDDAGRARVENAFFDMNVSNYINAINPDISWPRRVVARAAYGLLTMQPDLLTLFLVIFMGVLGSALQMTHSYFMKNQVQSIGVYFQRISVGAMTALVIFIVAKAGVPVIADPGRLGGDATINPYFVSFLAIISGLLSENAIANVQAQGGKFFGAGSAGPDRWMREDLTGELEKQNLPPGALAEHLGVDEAVAMTKLRGQDRIGPDQQKIISLFLRRDPRDIFTDIPPHGRSQ